MKAIKTQVVELKLTARMCHHFDTLCDYRRYIWNRALEPRQKMYTARILMLPDSLKQKLRDKTPLTPEEKILSNQNPSPTWQTVKKELLDNKADWETYRSYLLRMWL